MRKQGLGEMNVNCWRFADLCVSSNLATRGSVFQHRRIHKATKKVVYLKWINNDSIVFYVLMASFFQA
ncbi:hypothetical protein DPMN_017450 [Dreissena polymorpha]|uniref:Uncharacterized protein n=1 Tax=Dreissena polymorpha TaxID=45954 RepID=A0A9D4NGI2_DREPO|nr:hypothetical protein DPMN_017450 [Dreissena polymorpha]